MPERHWKNIGREGYGKGMKLLIDTNVILDMVFKRNDCEMEIMQFLRAEGCDKEDHASIVRYYEKLSGASIVKETQ